MIKILLADDHSMFREGLKYIIADETDMQVTGEAASSREAMSKIMEGDYDVVVLDISMPGRNGIDALTEIRNAKPNLAILVLSMHSEEQFALRALRAGAAGYLTKESAPDEFIAAIRKVAQGGKYVTLAVAEVLALDIDIHAERPPHEKLSDREYEVMLQISLGKRINEIAGELNLSGKTISTYRTRIMEKMEMATNTELTQYAIRNNLLS